MRNLTSKLPEVGTTIFTTMSELSNKHNAINLAQGFPDFDAHEYLKKRVCHYINKGVNQYAPMSGVPALNQAIANKIKQHYQCDVSPENEITVTSGATEALFAAIHAVTRQGDEAILFDPAYDSYAPAVELAGGKTIHLPLTGEDYSIDWDKLSETINDKTRLIIINSPHNPTGSILSMDDLEQLWQLIQSSNIMIVSDEVYEHIIFDGKQHASVLRHPELAERSFVISSFGKTFHMTGWKIGYCVAPQSMTMEFRKIHQFLTFCTSSPMQYGIADMLSKFPTYSEELPDFYEEKRNCFRDALKQTRFKLLPCRGTYFQLADYSEISDLDDLEFCFWLTKTVGIAAIPISPFYKSPSTDPKRIRFCFAKGEETLLQAGEILEKI